MCSLNCSVISYIFFVFLLFRTTSEACSGVITKCLNSSRSKTKEKGIEILMMYIEIEKQEIVQVSFLKFRVINIS